MSAENLQLVRSGYDAWNKRDVDGVLSFLHPEVDWRGYPHIPEAGTLRGRDEVKLWLDRFLDAWEELDVEVTDLIDADDRVVALVAFTARGRGSGAVVEGGVDAHVWTIREGKAVAVQMYQGTREALQVVGLLSQP
jgi:uncharacterized protein